MWQGEVQQPHKEIKWALELKDLNLSTRSLNDQVCDHGQFIHPQNLLFCFQK